MKKTLVAIAALAAFGAQAQSTATIYGSMDAGLFNATSAGVSNTFLTTGAHTSSRLGFRGTEDIGGGLKANFGLEAGLSIDNGSLGGPSGANGSTRIAGTLATDGANNPDAVGNASNQIFSRGAFVGLEGGFGKINAGKISTHSNAHILTYTPGATNIAAVSFRTLATTSSGWLDNTVEYVSPTMSGLTARILHTTGNTAAAATAAEGNTEANKSMGTGQEYGLSYVNGPLAAGAYTAARKTTASNTLKATTSAIGATYDFGVAKVGFTKNDSDPSDGVATDKIKGTSFSVTVPVNAQITLAGFYGNSKTQNDDSAKITSFNLDYALSKRTTAYTNYTQLKNNGGAAGTLSGMGLGNSQVTVAATAAEPKVSAFGVGIRHSF
jgi:predicted porin